MSNKTTPPARRWRPVRIRAWHFKLAYIILAVLVWVIIYSAGFFASSAAGIVALGVLQATAAFVLVVVATRIFRGPGEDLSAPRAWWRATNRTPASFVIGVAFLLPTLVFGVGSAGLASGVDGKVGIAQVPLAILSAVFSGILACVYLNSGVRLWRLHRDDAANGPRRR